MADTAVNTRQVGRVKWFNNQSGYGFITYTNTTGSEEDVFVHHSALVTGGDQFRYLVQGEYVEFETTQVEKSDSSPRIVAKDVRGMNGGMLSARLVMSVVNPNSSVVRTVIHRPTILHQEVVSSVLALDSAEEDQE